MVPAIGNTPKGFLQSLKNIIFPIKTVPLQLIVHYYCHFCNVKFLRPSYSRKNSTFLFGQLHVTFFILINLFDTQCILWLNSNDRHYHILEGHFLFIGACKDQICNLWPQNYLRKMSKSNIFQK